MGHLREDENEPTEPGVEPRGGSAALTPFLGQWVAMDEQREIRASGTTFDEAFEAAQAAGLRDPEFLFVPRPGYIGGATR